MWYAAGNPPSYEMAGRMGLGVLGFSLDRWDKVEKLRSAKIRRSRLFYLRALRGKAARLKEVERT